MLGLIISAIIGVLGVPTGIFLQYFLSAKERKRESVALASCNNRLLEYQKKYEELLDIRTEQSRRKISYQVDIVAEEVTKVRNAGRTPEVWILGINATGPLHQGRELLIDILQGGGKVRLLLLDPVHEVFAWRSDREHDKVGRLTAEMFASQYIILDILSQLPTGPTPQSGQLQIRLHHERPDRSLLMVNCEDKDGVVLENPYPELVGKRGLEGEMYPLVQRGRTMRSYLDNVKYYKGLWEGAREVQVNMPQRRLQLATWPLH